MTAAANGRHTAMWLPLPWRTVAAALPLLACRGVASRQPSALLALLLPAQCYHLHASPVVSIAAIAAGAIAAQPTAAAAICRRNCYVAAAPVAHRRRRAAIAGLPGCGRPKAAAANAAAWAAAAATSAAAGVYVGAVETVKVPSAAGTGAARRCTLRQQGFVPVSRRADKQASKGTELSKGPTDQMTVTLAWSKEATIKANPPC